MPLNYPPRLIQIMAAASGIAPICLLDVLTVDGTAYYWGQVGLSAPPVLLAAGDTSPTHNYLPYLLNLSGFHFYRSMQADAGSIDVQNVSGNTVQRDVATAITHRTFEGAIFVLREWYPQAEYAAFEMHGRLTVNDVTETVVTFDAEQLFNPSSYETPQYQYSETCQWRYASIPCGADGTNPCDNTFTTCRVPERFFGVLTNFTQDLTPGIANTSLRTVERARLF